MSTSDTRLSQFVDAVKIRGASDEGLAAILARQGWPASQVYAALGDYWARAAGVEIPRRAGSAESSRDAFLYLLAFSTLTTWTCALGSLLFELINHWLPDAVSSVSVIGLRSAVTWQLSSLAVAFPIYLLVMRRIVGETAAEPERLQSGVRKWLTWIALLITAGSMIGDLICFLDYFLTGELTQRFVLKGLVVFVITGAIFLYYTASLRAPRGASRDVAYGIGATAACAIVFATALFVAGTPGVQRHIEADSRRVNDLRQIAGAVFMYRAQRGSIPPSLSDPLIRQRLGTNAGADPESSAPYEYRPGGEAKYQLCAVFRAESAAAPSFWNHPAGRACFDLDATQTAPF